MLDIIRQILTNWFQIWTTNPSQAFFATWFTYGIGTFFLCLPVYCLTFGLGFIGIKNKFLTKLGGQTVVFNALLALAPCVLPVAVPCGMAYVLWQMLKIANKPQRNQRRQRRRPRPEPEDDDNDDVEGEEE